MKPWAIMTLISMPRARTGEFMDRLLYQSAVLRGKAVVGLESPQEQIAVLGDLTPDEQITLLREAVNNYPDMADMFEAITRAYINRDLARLQAVADEHMPGSDSQLSDKIEQLMVVDRNHRMVRRLAEPLQQGNSFVAIGALHLPGEEGVLRLLAKQGYTVVPLY
jgi:hypothetical protein